MFDARYSKVRAFLMFGLIIGAAWLFQQCFSKDETILVNGQNAQVIDGDSFKIGSEDFRIYGVDAPEYRQNCKNEKGADWPCGRFARSGLERLLREEDHNCIVHARDQFGRAIVLCTSETGKDLSTKLVAEGLAVSGQNYDEVIYATDERGAQKSKRGIWQGEFIRPEIWRTQNPRN